FIAASILVKKQDDKEDEAEVTERTSEIELAAVTTGSYVSLEEVKDDAFASKALGDGYAIKPNRDEVFSPVSGEITTVFPT
ncbi:PTS glucose transporter subunit IIA, partial [Alkalibacillus haloalkaliphilus]|uniref:PTS glucose transporter subunit IIA n=1 Tax=Alkalibacillus haloalkaliphilus TaxID=94136 RepID=UPI00293696F2